MVGIAFSVVFIAFWYKLDKMDKKLTMIISDSLIGHKMDKMEKQMKNLVTEMRRDGWNMKQFFWGVAQSAEHRTVNATVGGSSPPAPVGSVAQRQLQKTVNFPV